MNSNRFIKVGDIVLNEFKEKYDREMSTGVVIETKDSLYKVKRLGKDEKGYFATGYFEWRGANQLKLTGERIEDLKTLYL